MDSNSFSSSSNPELSDRPLLVTPSDRLRFVSLYMLVTVVAWYGFPLLWRGMISTAMPEPKLLLHGFFLGAVVGSLQWLVLRRYIPSWHWIAANTVGQFIVAIANEAWFSYLSSQQGDLLGFLDIFTSAPMPLPLFLLATVPLVLLQWGAIRRYVQSALWWLLTLISFSALYFGFLILQELLHLGGRLPIFLEWSIILPGIWGTVQAIAFCLFRSQRGVPQSELPADSSKGMSVTMVAAIALGAVTVVAAVIGSWEVMMILGFMR